jgi:hypothetical protein
MSLGDSEKEKIHFEFQTLSHVASSLNFASDELTKAVVTLDEALKKLNIGLTVWVDYESVRDEPATGFDAYQIGYAKVNGKWGISLQHVWGDYRTTKYGNEGPWLFNDAPRDLRLKSVDKIPALIEALSNEASQATHKIQEKTQEVRTIASIVERIPNIPPGGLRHRLRPTPHVSALDPTPVDKTPMSPTPRISPLIPSPDNAGSKEKGGK